MHVASLIMEIVIKRQIWMSNAIYHLLIFLLSLKVNIIFKGLNTLSILRVSKLYFFLSRVYKVTKLVLVVLKSNQINISVS
jgi:hypothetical protein